MFSTRRGSFRRKGKECDYHRSTLNGDNSSAQSSTYGNGQFLSTEQSSTVHSEIRKQEKGNGGNLGPVSDMELKNNYEEDEEDNALTKLLLRSEEPELSEEQLRINDQAQEDELLAMESIYGDSVSILDRKNGLRYFEIHIDVETKEVSVSVKMNSSTILQTKAEYLPPIILTCVLPQSYPSHRPPYFTISSQWLHSTKIASLCSILDSIWKEQSGQEIIYHWVEWLHTSCLSFLGFVQELTLGPYSGMHEKNSRAISRSLSPEVDIQSIRSYNDEQLSEKFSTNIHECCICFSEFPGTEFARLPCQHFFCLTCMKTYSDMHMKEGTVQKLLCPDAKCGGMIPPGLLRRLLSDEDFERWESMMLERTLESMSDVTYCPRCKTICIEDEDSHAQCSECLFSFCSLCKERRHVGGTCTNPEMKLLVLQERQTSSQSRNELEKRRKQEMINEILSLREIHLSTKQCPSCNMAISRTVGCNHMDCRNCGCHFCYRCCKKIDGYGHFSEGKCTVHPEDETETLDLVERRNIRRMEDDRQSVAGVQVQVNPGSVHQCPSCRQLNVKVGNNNHMFCWACQTDYCFLCKRSARRPSQHFGRGGGCKQHTTD